MGRRAKVREVTKNPVTTKILSGDETMCRKDSKPAAALRWSGLYGREAVERFQIMSDWFNSPAPLNM